MLVIYGLDIGLKAIFSFIASLFIIWKVLLPGLLNGENPILFVSLILILLLLKSINEMGNKDDFIGHIGEDDFVIITTPDRDIKISKYIIEMFDNCIKEYLNNNDKKRGYYLCSDRQGCLSKIPLTVISIAIVSNENSNFENHL